jgi:predicted deacetylase
MKKAEIVVLVIIALLIILFIIRLISPKEIDDISPEIPCSELDTYSSEILYVIPYYNEKPISENKPWCDYILSLNKTLAMHGIYHTYDEFKTTKSQEELNKGIEEFEKCFGYKPKIFKAPQLKINKQNRLLIKNNNLILKNQFSQATHKVYHCNNTGILDNRVINTI